MAKDKKKRKDKRSYKMKLKPETAKSISQIIFFGFAALIIVSFSREGSILVKLNNLLLQLFSWTALLLPFIFVSFGFLLSKFKRPLGQPNVIIGFLLFFISINAITKAGSIGTSSWDSVSALITGFGAFILYFGVIMIGLVILFNTSLDAVFTLIAAALTQLKKYILGEKNLTKLNLKDKKGPIVGGMTNTSPTASEKQNTNIQQVQEKQEPIEAKLVSNVPGETKVWKYPPLSLLSAASVGHADRGDIKGNAQIVEQTLDSFGVTARVVEINIGPAVTQYALEVALGTKLTKITSLERDLARALASPTGAIRIEAPIPGRNLVGIELQ